MEDAGQLLRFVLDTVLKATFLLSAASAVAYALRGAAARGRQLVWAVGLLGALALPALSPLLPAWNLPLLSWPEVPAAVPDAFGAVSPVETSVSLGAGMAQSVERPDAFRPVPDAPSSIPGLITVVPDAFGAVAADEVPDAFGEASTREVPEGSYWSLSVPYGALAGLWLLGCALLIGRWALGQGRAYRLAREARIAGDGQWCQTLKDCRRRLRLRRSVSLLFHPSVHTPMTWGLIAPVVLLPAGAERWSAERREVVLLHELLHVRRNDWLLRSAAQLACAVYWFHPLVWLGLRRLTIEQETACDDGVLALGTAPSRYADHLLAIARAALRPASRPYIPLPAVEMAGRSPMEARLMSILSFSRRPRPRRPLIPALFLAAALVPALAALQIWAAPGAGADAADLARAAESANGDVESANEWAAQSNGHTVRASSGLQTTLAELQALEQELRPFEAQLEELEREMKPIEAEIEMGASGHEPFEHEMEAIEARFAPFEERMEAVEAELQPFEDQLEALAAQMRPFEERMEQIAHSSLPSDEGAEAFEREMEPVHRRLEALAEEMEPLSEEMERIHDAGEHDSPRLQELRSQMEAVHAEMEKVHLEMEPIHQRMESFHQDMEPMRLQMEAIHREMEPLHAQMRAIHEQMGPVHDRMEAIHQEIEPLHLEMQKVHEKMRPVHQEMERFHERMEPIHQRMQGVHEQMKPIHQEMERVHQELQRELRAALRGILAEELSGLKVSAASLDRAAREIADAVSLEVNDGRMSVRASMDRLRATLSSALGGEAARSASQAAIERAARAISNLEILYEN